MSGDLYRQEAMESLSRFAPVQSPEASAFDGFAKGVGMATMRGFAQTARGIDLAGSALPVIYDKFVGGTEAQDRYFKEHEEAFEPMIEYWTPKPNEVGEAGNIVGSLLSTLPMVMVAPELALTGAVMGPAEDLSRRGVTPGKAVSAGVVEGATLATGIWMPILGGNLWQRVVLGGAGFNVAQGILSRAAEGMILEGTPAGADFKAFDGKAMTLDALMGAAFGVMTHINPEARAQGKEAWERIAAWAEKLNPSDVDALLVLRQAQHLNEDSLPGKPQDAKDIDAHVERTKAAITALAEGRDVKVDDMPAGRFEADEARWQDDGGRAKDLVTAADEIRKESGLPKPPETEGPQAPRSGPPPGEGKPVGPEADPIAAAAQSFAETNKDMKLRLGTDADGKPITRTVGEFLGSVKADVAKVKEDVKLFAVAAQCMLGVL